MISVSSLLVAAITCCLLSAVTEGLQDDPPTCRDENGNPVDWFIAYKLPRMRRESAPFNSGRGYAYMTSVLSKRPGWTLAKHPIDHPNSMIMRSLASAYSPTKPATLNWILYSDQPPKSGDDESSKRGGSASRAHAKGAILIDSKGGDAMWLTHSVPQFPPLVGEPLAFNDNAFRHGQTFMCLTFDARADGDKVTRHLSNMFALIYNSKVSPRLRKLIPELEELKLEDETKGLHKSARLEKLEQTITTLGGQQFELFSKSSNFEDDMYAGWLADELDSPLMVETWRNGVGDPLDSDCPRDRYQVKNIKEMRLVSGSKALFHWSYLKDHSKWAISETREDGVVCLADINRMASQFKRGGGAVCLKCPNCWSAFSSTIVEVEKCRYKSKKQKTASN